MNGGSGMKVGYVRVSTDKQHNDRQDVVMAELAVEKVYSEKVSGRKFEREKLKELLAFVREGDVVVVESLSRLARSTRDLLNIMHDFSLRGISFISHKEKIDTTTPQGRFAMTVFAALAELEVETLLQRQGEGIVAAKARGVRFGRPPLVLPENWVATVAEWRSGAITATRAAVQLGMCRSSLYKQWQATSNSAVAG